MFVLRGEEDGEVFWDAQVDVVHGDGSVSLLFNDGETCTWGADLVTDTIKHKAYPVDAAIPIHAQLMAAAGQYMHKGQSHLKWYQGIAVEDPSDYVDQVTFH